MGTASALARHVGAIDGTIIARGEVVALAWCAVALVGGGVIDGHVIVLEQLTDLGDPLGWVNYRHPATQAVASEVDVAEGGGSLTKAIA